MMFLRDNWQHPYRWPAVWLLAVLAIALDLAMALKTYAR